MKVFVVFSTFLTFFVRFFDVFRICAEIIRQYLWRGQVRDGQTASASLIGRYCGHVMPAAIATSSRYLYIRFVSDASDQRNGFSLDYVTNGQPADCLLTYCHLSLLRRHTHTHTHTHAHTHV